MVFIQLASGSQGTLGRGGVAKRTRTVVWGGVHPEARLAACFRASDTRGKAARPEGNAQSRDSAQRWGWKRPVMILPQVHLRKPCYDFSFL